MITSQVEKNKYIKEDLKAITFKYRLFKPQSFLAYFFQYQYAFLYRYLYHLRNAEYTYNCKPPLWKIRYFYHNWRMRIMANKLGNIEIPINTLGYGTRFPHIGKIIINKDASIGNYCTIYPGVCIGKKENGEVPKIENHCYIGIGAKIIGKVTVPDNSIIAPNAVVIKCTESNSVVLGGIPAKILKVLTPILQHNDTSR